MPVTLTSKVLHISRQIFDTLVGDANNVLDDIKGELENDSELSNIIGTSSNFNISIGLTLREKIVHYENYTDNAKIIFGPIGTWNTSNVTDMSSIFLDSSLNEDISSWDTSSVTTMSNMFRNATKFNQDISSWDISAVTDFSNMFSGTTELSNNNRIRTVSSFVNNSNWIQHYSDWKI